MGQCGVSAFPPATAPAETCSEASLAREWLAVGREQARRTGVPEQDMDDCGIGFVVQMLRLHRAGHVLQTDMDPAPWARRCARNYALSFRRQAARGQLHEQLGADGSEAEDAGGPHEAGSASISDSELELLRHEFWALIRSYVGRLRPRPQQIFARYYLEGEAVESLAESFHVAPCAIDQSLHRARLRVRKLIREAGYTAEGLLEYLDNL